jgi:hypothetical protein
LICYKLSMAFVVAVVVAVIGFAVWRAAALTGAEVAGWARAHALVLTAENQPMVTWYLRTSALLRTLGVLAGLLLPSLVVTVFGLDSPGPSGWSLIFGGYLLGALYAEVALARPREGRALLVPRALGDYLPRRLVRAQRVVGLAACLGAVMALGWVEADAFVGTRAWLVGAAVTGLAVAFGLEWLERWIVRRPQTVTSPSMVSADDAIRAQSVHSMAGAGLAMALVALGVVASYLAASDVQELRWIFTIPSILFPWSAIFVCLHYGHRSWRVTRFDKAAKVRSAC